MEYVYDDRFEMPRRVFQVLLATSLCWLCIDGFPVLPIGLFAAIRYVGRNYEVTFFKSLAAGWKVIAACAAIALIGLFIGPAMNVGVNPKTGVLGFSIMLGLVF